MEISLNSRLRRTEVLMRQDGTKKDVSLSAAEARPRTDRVTLDRQAISQLEEQSRRIRELAEWNRQPRRKVPAPWDILDAGKEEQGGSELDALEKGLKIMKKCQEIAARIMRGDKVPPQDERYLMENDPNGYKLAMAMRKPKKNPKKWDSIVDKEKQSSQTGGSEEAGSSCERTTEASADSGASSESGTSAGEG